LEIDRLCPITISSFYRDQAVFDYLGSTLLRRIAQEATAREEQQIYAWSIGCASGEEPYTLMLLWRWDVQPQLPAMGLYITATDIDETVLARARVACYPRSSLKHLPTGWRERAFEPQDGRYCLQPLYRQQIEFLQQDVRTSLPGKMFHLILCRNLICTYYDEVSQQRILGRALTRLAPGGYLVIGRQETPPSSIPGLTAVLDDRGIYRKS